MQIDKYTCLIDKNYSVAGNFYADQFSYFEIKILVCNNSNPNANCWPRDKIDTYIIDTTISFAFLN